MSEQSDLQFVDETDEKLAAQAKAFEAQTIAAEQLRDAFSQLFSTPNGQMVLAYLARRYRLYKPLLDPGEGLELLATREGARSVVLDIVQRVAENDPDLTLPPN